MKNLSFLFLFLLLLSGCPMDAASGSPTGGKITYTFEGIPPYIIRFLNNDLRHTSRTIQQAPGAPVGQLLVTKYSFDYMFPKFQEMTPTISLEGAIVGFVKLEVLIKTDKNTLLVRSTNQGPGIRHLMERIVIPF